MKALTTAGLTKLIQLIKSSFISTSDTVTTNTVTLAAVATSGDFDDLINQPTIGNGTITFTQGGVSKGTITANQTGNSTIALDAGGTVDQTYDGTSANAQSGVAINGAKFLRNTATNNTSIAIGNAATATGINSVILGTFSSGTNKNAIAIGAAAMAGENATAIGNNAEATSNSAIQIGYGTNLTANTLRVGFYNNSTTHYNWQLLDGTTGLIPDARISSNIARTSAIPTDTNDLTNGAGYITGITSGDVTNALTYTPADTDLSNLSATGKTVIDGQWVSDNSTVVEGLQLNTSTNISYTLPVPNDGYKYEVILTCTVESTATSGQQTAIYLSSTEMPYAQCVARAMPRSSASVTAGGSIIIPIGTDRKLTVVRTTTFYGTGYIYLRGYRRIGSNT